MTVNFTLMANGLFCVPLFHGGHSRLPEKCPKHSFRIDFQSEYGPSKLDYPLFGKSEAQQINSFILRAGFGNTWLHQTALERSRGIYTRDAWAKRTQKRMGQLSANTQYAHLFLNGLYWGLYNPTERIDDDFCATYLGGKKSEYDVIKVEDTKQAIIASDGTLAAWNKLISTVAGAADPAVYQRLQGKNADGTTNTAYECLLDVDNFIDYMQSPFQAVVKYDVYDPNTAVSGNEIGKTVTGAVATGTADIKYSTIGLGLNYNFNSNVRLMAYYDIVKNETTSNIRTASTLSDLSKDRKDNVFTFRIQYKF